MERHERAVEQASAGACGRPQRRRLGVLGSAALIAGGCNPQADQAAPTWHRDIAPIVAEHCLPCHTPGGPAPFSLESYEGAAAFSGLMAQATSSGVMPPWAADSAACDQGPAFRGDLRLSAEQIALFGRWADNGAPEGETLAPIVPPTPAQIETDLSLALATPIELDGQADRIMCHIFDPQLAAPQWLRAVDVSAGSARAVHHVNLFVDTSGIASDFDADADGWFGCFNFPEALPGYQAGSLVPGTGALVLPNEVGMYVPAGATIVAQIHYEATGVSEVDADTQLHIDWATQAPRYVASVAVIGNQGAQIVDGTGLEPGLNDPADVEFFIPAGAQSHEERMRTRILGAAPARIWSLTNHMHYAGTRMKLERLAADGNAPSCLLDTPRWDLDWQRTYVLDGPIDEMPWLAPGDTLLQTCGYNNSQSNDRLMQGLEEAGAEATIRDIRLGDTSLDEMCLSFVGLAVEI